jgi:D-glycero-alpha-D-manno-heptose-7-phosphate kinase
VESAKLLQRLKELQKTDLLPAVIAYQRIDGPGSSLDLREFQQALWSLPEIPPEPKSDPALTWTKNLPRTVAITIDTGTKVTAYPFEPAMICVESKDYGFELISPTGQVLPNRESWLLKIMEIFGLSGVKFVVENLRPNIKSSGLGGSATATTGVCVLANELAKKPFSAIQLISMASRIEQDLGVSIVGTQEQSNVLFGGVTDYVWFPWGVPHQPQTGYGESLRTELIPPKDYSQLEARLAIFHTGKTRKSTNVNSAWRHALVSPEGYALHRRKPQIAYAFREALRLRKWRQAMDAICEYREIRTVLCSDYMDGAEEIAQLSRSEKCVAFPLGAGGGGSVMVFAEDPSALLALRQSLQGKYEEISFKIKETGHVLVNPVGGT